MINVLRKNQKALWIVIALLCIPFVFYFSNSRVGPIGNNELGKIYGRPVPSVELQRNARLFTLASSLGMYAFLQEMVAGATSQNDAYMQFTWNRLILHHEADRLGIQPTTEQIVPVVKELMPFRGQNGFDATKYNEFTQNTLPTLGFSEAEIEELAGDQLILQRVKELLGTGVQVSEAESRESFERTNSKLEIALVRLRSDDLAKQIQVTDDDVAKFYEAHKQDLNTEEKRKVSFVTFGLDDEQKKLAGRERVEMLQKLADRANDFNQALLPKGTDFEQAAAKFQLPVQASGEFTKTAPDPSLKSNPQLTSAAFELTPQDPNSDAVQVADSFYVLHLSGTEPARPLSLEEAKGKIVESLKAERLKEMVATKGAEIAQKMREAMKTGTPVEAAAQQAGATLEKIPPFSLADAPPPKPEAGKPAPAETPDLPLIKRAVSELSAGEVSDVVPTPSGAVIAILEKREAPDPIAFEAGKGMLATQALSGKREVAFYEWMRERRREAGVQPTAG